MDILLSGLMSQVTQQGHDPKNQLKRIRLGSIICLPGWISQQLSNYEVISYSVMISQNQLDQIRKVHSLQLCNYLDACNCIWQSVAKIQLSCSGELRLGE